MPYEINWLIRGRVLEHRLWGEQTIEDIESIRQEAATSFLPDAAPPRLHLLFDITELESFSFNVAEFMASPLNLNLPEDKLSLLNGWRIYFGKDDKTFRLVVSIFHQSHGHSIKWFPTREEAISFLSRIDSTLLTDGG